MSGATISCLRCGREWTIMCGSPWEDLCATCACQDGHVWKQPTASGWYCLRCHHGSFDGITELDYKSYMAEYRRLHPTP